MSQLEELRQIIVGADAEKLAELKERIENIESRTKDVLEVLPPAIIAGVEQDDRLIEAFKKPISESLKQAIRAEPEEYAQILYPVMGPSIRRAITQAMTSMMVTINHTIESATSAEGLKLRMQAMRTGVPYAELALRKSLKFKVEHLYLIDRDSSICIADIAGEGVSSLDSDAVSGMLSAIQSFVQDSFSQNEEDRLTDFKVGEYKVWLAHSPNAMLACVIFGNAPESLKHDLYDMLDGVRTDYAQELADFDGDSSTFAGIEDKLEPLLQLELLEGDDGLISRPSIAQTLISIVLIASVYYFAYNWFVQNSKINTAERYLKEVPGLFVTQMFWDNDNIVIEGLQDFDAQIPYAILSANNIDKDTLQFKTAPFRSLDPDVVMTRLIRELVAPDGVQFNSNDQGLFIEGHAPIEWLLNNDIRLRQLVVEDRLDTTKLYASFSSLRQYFSDQLEGLGGNLLELSNTPWLEISIDVFEK